MDLKELITFRTIIKEKTFSNAAIKLHYAQSTITNQVQRLEKELGIKLFERGWDAELTPAGRVFAEEVESLINHWNFVSEQAKFLQKEEIGVLNIGIIETLAVSILPNVLKKFAEYKPNIECNFIVGNTEALSYMLLKDSMDFAICSSREAVPDLKFEYVYNEKISFIAHNEHPFAEKESISLEDLSKYPLITGGKNCLYSLRLEEATSKLLNKPFCYSISQISAIPHFAEKLSGIGVIISSVELPKNFIQLPFNIANPYIPIGILQKSKNQYLSSTRKLFLEILREELAIKNYAW
ncbi:LysR family transcriptional regulator [Clostridium sp. 19966]|uniref:LysR family transcriptional regulator n=1 Tax=Clostridium sp. 19966 TaxID=2768166 RepID=UPI0028DEBE6F|nr:LysR family transcriptional regulator [Clostridium sp. 19966]MDT8715420.1 LysR family transcriptional regulator [Clostridium sp. 19966]